MDGILINTWYMAAWSHEIGDSLLRRRIIGEPILLYRLADGSVTALTDRCPHRFAPLSKGERVGGGVRCGYHGLGFDASGACIHNPFGDAIPKGASVRHWPVIERDGIVWLWSGEPALADPSTIPDFAMLDRPCGPPLTGMMAMQAHYEYGTDNLMDLSHIEFVHKGSFAGAGVIFAGQHELHEDGDTLHSNWWMPNVPAPAHTFGIYQPGMPTDHWLDMRWNAPASMYLQIGATPIGQSRDIGVVVHQAHILTPETDGTAHYFWATTRSGDIVDPGADGYLKQLLGQAFDDEDKPMIEAAYANMDGAGFWDRKPVFLGIDAGGTRARRKLEQMAAREAKAHSVKETA